MDILIFILWYMGLKLAGWTLKEPALWFYNVFSTIVAIVIVLIISFGFPHLT